MTKISFNAMEQKGKERTWARVFRMAKQRGKKLARQDLDPFQEFGHVEKCSPRSTRVWRLGKPYSLDKTEENIV